MSTPQPPATDAPFIQHAGETTSNSCRHLTADTEPLCLRTRTPTLAVLARSSGSYHFTPEGRKLADFTSGVLVANLGHHPRRWWQRVMQHMALEGAAGSDGYAEAVTLTAYNAVTEVEAEANRRLLANLHAQPGGARMQQVLWAASGSEAMQKGLWAALAKRPQGDGILLATRGGFHGKKGLAGAVTGSETDKERDPRVRFISFPKAECASIERRRQPIDLTSYAAELEALKAEFGDRLCALITEPYLGGGGSYHPHPEYLQLLQRFCRDNDVLFFLDEIQSNFGRTGPMYAFTHYGLEPDLVALGKGMANGMPVDAVVGRADVFARLSYGEGSDTWSAHPLGCAAVLATLDEFEQTDVLARGLQLSAVIEENLQRLAQLPTVAAVRGEGTVWGIEFAAVGDLSAEAVAQEVVRRCYLGDDKGRAIHLLGPLAGKVVRIAPPLTMDLDEAREYFATLHALTAGIA
ncbi:MAG: aminotransferase class III-fold pyridoxal phosphate-dependent enzyme [Verrucomicrobiales bacterium]|nr:aminotransferase class III-fold pyridoxal phosphate-dependent enzyme [Verrucomicrobiales bacterium]